MTRILLTTDAIGGVWRYAVDLVGVLDQAGLDCLLLGFGPEPDDARRRECRGWRTSELAWCAHGLDWIDAAEFDPGCDDLIRHARGWRADILHLHQPSHAAAVPPGLPVLVVAHSCQATWWDAAGDGPAPKTWQPGIERTRRGLIRADRILAPTHAHADALRRVYGPLDRISIVPNATAAIGPFGAKEPLILAAGRWWDRGKNANVLDEACRDASWPVHLAGALTGPDGVVFRPGHAIAHGEVPNPELRRLMSRASIFASPSLYEPFGLAVLEAAAHACALVLSDIPSFRELWTGAALFADPRDPAAFALAFETLSADASLRAHLGDRAARIASSFTLARQRGAVLAAYDPCLPEHAA